MSKEKLTRALHMAGFKVSKHAPEIMAAVGVVSFAGTIVTCAMATPKAQEIVNEAKDGYSEIDKAKEIAEENDEVEYTEEDARKDTVIVTAKAAGQLVETYAPTVAFAIITLVCFLGGHKILSERNTALTALAGTLQNTINGYRAAVREKVGADEENDIWLGLEDKVKSRRVKDEKTGKTKTIKEHEKTIKAGEQHGAYMRIFDDTLGPDYWSKDPAQNKWFLDTTEKYFNDLLNRRGYVFLNEVYQRLGFEQTTLGQIVGWLAPEFEDIEGAPVNSGNQYRGISFYGGMGGSFNNHALYTYEFNTLSGVILDFNADGVIFESVSHINDIPEE